MAIIKALSRSLRSESLSGRIMVDTVRGVLRVRKWPKKRGTPKSERQLYWIDWFRQANKLTKYVDAASMRRAIRITAGSGIYPRDILLKAMRGRLYTWNDQTGHRWYSMAAVQDISDTLDALAQNIGSVLVRAADRWRAPAPGNFDDVLTYKSDTEPPVWQAGGGGGGVTQQVLPGTPLEPDDTANYYDFDVSDYFGLSIILKGLEFAASDYLAVRVSTDDGATFHDGAADYWNAKVSAGTDQNLWQTFWTFAITGGVSSHNCIMNLTNLRAGRCSMSAVVTRVATDCMIRNGFITFDGPVTHVRLFSTGGNNLSGGAIELVGLK